jgi:hypothetical protein
VVVNGWWHPPFGYALDRVRKFVLRVNSFVARRIFGRVSDKPPVNPAQAAQRPGETKSTFTAKNSAAWLKRTVGAQMPLEIFVWRSVSVKVMRTFIHERWGGRSILKMLFWLEERFPHWFGENGQYPLVVVKKLHQDGR